MESTQMRDFSEFCDQLNEMNLLFHKWDSCERTVALYYLMIGLPFPNSRFLQHALEQLNASISTPESRVLERNANDPAFISTLLIEQPQIALSQLLRHVPLLRPNNKETADCYLRSIRRVLTEFIVPPFKIYNECIEILSYVFVHPAFGREDKKSFKQLLEQVMDRVSSKKFMQSPVNESSDESVSPNPEPMNFPNHLIDNVRLNRRSNSLTPVPSSSNESLLQVPDYWSSQENLSHPVSKPRSYSLSNDKTLPVNSNSMQTSSSETRLQDLQTLNNLPVMKGIICWLKSLRLHKYSWVFNNLSYEQMLGLTDENLEVIGITKGARHKILISIAKLKERNQVLTELETEVMNGGDLLSALKKLRGIIQTPLQTTVGENLPSQFVKVMGKVCTQLLMLRQPSDDCLVLFSTLCERAETLDAFSIEQKRRLTLWCDQLARGCHIANGTHRQHSNAYTVPSYAYALNGGPSYPPPYTHKSSSYPSMKKKPAIRAHRHSLGSTTLQNQLYTLGSQLPSCTQNISCIINNNDPQAACGYGISNKQMHVRFKDDDCNRSAIRKNDIDSSLESLCLQMMEHALGP